MLTTKIFRGIKSLFDSAVLCLEKSLFDDIPELYIFCVKFNCCTIKAMLYGLSSKAS